MPDNPNRVKIILTVEVPPGTSFPAAQHDLEWYCEGVLVDSEIEHGYRITSAVVEPA